MAIIGSASVEIRAVDKLFEADVKKIVSKIKPVEVPVIAKLDTKLFDKELNKFRNRLKKENVTLKADIDLGKVSEKVEEAYDLYKEAEFEFNATANVDAAIAEIEKLNSKATQSTVTITAKAQTALAEAQMALAARDRVSNVKMNLDIRNSDTFLGMLNVLTGTLPFDKVYAATTGIAANFEAIATAGTAAIVGIGALSSSVITLGSSLVAIGGDLVQMGNLLAFLPAGIIAITSVLKANKMAWQDFGTAATDNSEKANLALAKLPPQAQEAAVALRGLKDEMQNSVQNAFWFQMGDSLQDMVTAIFPDVKNGLTAIGSALGFLQADVFDTVAEFGTMKSVAEPGLSVIENILGNVAIAVERLTEGASGATEAFTYFAEVGSSYLPEFATWLSNLGERFGAFAKEARDNGDMLRWMDTGIQRAQELGSIIGSTGGILKGFYDIANKGGSAGLTELADGFKRVAEVVQSEPYQSQMVTGLEGARAGAAAMGDAIAKLHAYFLQSADSAAAFLQITGEIAGIGFENIISLFDGTGLGHGLYTALADAKQAIIDLEPSFGNVGRAIGDLGEIAGELFLNMAPGINLLTELISGVIAELKDGIIAAMPVFNAFIQSIIGAAQGPIMAFADAIGNILVAFSNMPGPVQTALAALGLVLLLRPKFDALWRGISGGATGAFAQVARDSNGSIVGLTRWGTAVSDAGTRVKTAWGDVGRTFSTVNTSAAEGQLRNLSTTTGTVTRAIGTSAGQGLRLAGSGLMTMLGGPWGVALAAATAVLATWGQGQLESKQRVEALTKTLQEQNGEWTKVSEEMLATNLMDGATTKWDDFFRGVIQGAKSTEEIVSIMGTSFSEISDILADSSSRDAYVSGLEGITSAMKNFRPVTDEMLASVGMTRQEFEQLDANDLQHLTNEVRGVAEEAARAERAAALLSAEFGTSTVQSAQLAANFKILESTTSSVSSKMGAFKQNLDIITGGARSAGDATQSYNDTMRSAGETLSGFEAANGVAIASLVNVSGQIDTTSAAGSQLRTAFSDQATAIQQLGIEAFNTARSNDQSLEASTVAAVTAMQGPVDQFRRQLADFGIPPGVIDKILGDFGLLEKDVEASLMADGDQAISEAARVQVVLDAYATGNYEAVLGALPDEAKSAISMTMGLGKEFAAGDYQAILESLDKTLGGKESALATLATFKGGTREEWIAFLEARDLTSEGVESAKNTAGGVANLKPVIPINALDNAAEGTNAAKATAKSAEYLKPYIAIRATDSTAEGKASAAASLASVADRNAKINAINNAAKGAAEAGASMATVTDIRRDISAVNKAGAGAAEAKATMASPPNVSRDITANNKTQAGTSSAIGVMKTPPHVYRDIFANNKTGPGTNSSIGTMKSTPNVNRDITASNKTGPGTSSAISLMRTPPNVTRDIMARNLTGGPTSSATGNLRAVPNVTVSVNAVDNASGVARNIKAELAGIQSKTVTVTTLNQRVGVGQVGRNADGGVWKGGVRAFANGGITGGSNVKAFANGAEKHVAQIAKGRWPVRIWAEPETQGEAYIPLAKRKRKRSVEILQRVASEFGLGMFKKYADGGLEMGRNGVSPTGGMFSSSGGSSSFRSGSGGDGPNLVVQVNPSAGLDERQIGDAAAETLYWNFVNR